MTTSLRPPTPHSRRRLEHIEMSALGDGIDYLEVDPTDHTKLTVGLINTMPGSGPWSLDTNPALTTITGGEKIRGIRAKSVTIVNPRTLLVTTNKPGDFSPYVLEFMVPDLDPVLRRITFSFMAACPSDWDCENSAPQTFELDGPPIDTLAKDYNSFRQMLFDLMALRHPSQVEHHAADLGVTLMEALAAYGDELSYEQDAAFQEAYLETAQRRISVRRHTKFVDYALSEGRNAFAPIYVAVNRNITIALGTQLFTRLPSALPRSDAAPGAAFDVALLTPTAYGRKPLAEATIFESAHTLNASPLSNVMHIHFWGEDTFSLSSGSTSAWLWSEDPANPTIAATPLLSVGDRIVIEQIRDSRTGDFANVAASERWLLTITGTAQGSDPIYTNAYGRDAEGSVVMNERTNPLDAPLPLLGITWLSEEAPARDICVRSVSEDGTEIADVSIVRGNIVLADHGRTIADVDVTPFNWRPDTAIGTEPGVAELVPPLRLQLPDAPLTQQIGRLGAERHDLMGAATAAEAALALSVQQPFGPPEAWLPVPDLFESGPDDSDVVVEVDNNGRGLLRFGDGVLGRSPNSAVGFRATYRIGNGTSGNVGADSLVHVALPASDLSAIIEVRNPLTADLGTDPESLEHAKQLAPDAFKAWQDRAVIADDVVQALLRLSSVRAAVAALRWTGSWFTWIVSVLPVNMVDLVDTGSLHQALSSDFASVVSAQLERVRLAGFDYDLRPPEFVPVDLRLHICAKPGHTRSDVARAVRDSLLAASLPNGKSGLYANFTLTFGRSLLLSEVYATVASVVGVESVKATWLARYDEPSNGELAAGRLDVAPWQLLRLDDDLSIPSRGRLGLSVDGGMP